MCEMSEERTYYIRTSLMYTDLTREVLFKVFKYLIKSEDITGFLSSLEQQNILRVLFQKNAINRHDYDLVSGHVLNLERFDTSLLIRLILNLCKDNIQKPQRGWQTKPHPKDEGLCADLLRLRDVRNKIIGHRADAKLSEAEYEKTWAKIKAILLRVIERVDSKPSENFERRINKCKQINVDTDNARVKRLLDELLSNKKDFDRLQEKVEELSRRSQEFQVYFQTTPDRFVRYIKLLFDGGHIVLCGILKKMLGDKDLSEILDKKKETLTRNIEEKFTSCLFQHESCSDHKKWDVFLLASVLLFTFDDDLSQNEIMNIGLIKSARVNYAVLALQSLDADDFMINWTDLIVCLQDLSRNIAEVDKLQVENLIERYKKNDEGGCDAEEYFKQLRESGVEVKTLNDVYNETITELKDRLNMLSQKDITFKQKNVFEFKLLATCENEEITKRAENLLENNLQASIQNLDQASDILRGETDKLVAIIAAHPDVTPVEVKQKCIILSFKCSTPGGLVHILDITHGDQFRSTFRNIANELHYIYGYVFLIQGKCTLESVSRVSKMINKSTTNEASSKQISISLECSSVDGIRSVLSAIKQEKTTKSLNRIADQMSAMFNETISIKLILDMMEFRNVFEETDSEGSSSLGSNEFETEELVPVKMDQTDTHADDEKKDVSARQQLYDEKMNEHAIENKEPEGNFQTITDTFQTVNTGQNRIEDVILAEKRTKSDIEDAITKIGGKKVKKMSQNPDNRVKLFRLHIIIIDGGLLVLRNIIDQILTTKGMTLSACLNNEKATIARLKSRGVITQVQYDILFPTDGRVPTTSDMDFTLITCLLRFLKCFGFNKKFDWNTKPISTDLTVEADICRLKAYRNEICHVPTTTRIQTYDFVNWWNDIEQILVRLSSQALNIHQVIADFNDCPLDPEEEKRLQEEVKRWKDYEADVDGLNEEMKKMQTDVIEVKKEKEAVKKEIEAIKDRQDAEKSNEGNTAIQTEEEKYQTRKKELQCDLIKFYRKSYSSIPLSPLLEEIETPLAGFYVMPDIVAVKQKSLIFHEEERTPIKSLKDMFTTGSGHQPEIYLSADAGFGKTAFSKYLAITWCQAHHHDENYACFKDDELKTLFDFKFLFLVLLRNCSSYCNIDDLIEHQITKKLPSSATMHEVLRGEKCLIILDGLDEWTHPDNSCSEVTENIPHRYVRDNCVILTTTRPWKLGVANLKTSQINKKVELFQLSADSTRQLEENAIRKMTDVRDYRVLKRKRQDFNKVIRDRRLEHMQMIPLLLIYIVGLWCNNIPIGNSKHEIYTNIIEFLLLRTSKKHPEVQPSRESSAREIPEHFSSLEFFKKFYSLITSVAELAYQTLFNENRENTLVFDRRVAEKYLRADNMKLSLLSGIMSESRSKTLIREIIKVSFSHKTVQEFFAAIFISSQNDAQKAVLEKCRNVQDILEMSKVCEFISGMNADQICEISNDLMSVINEDEETRDYRTRTGDVMMYNNPLYNIQEMFMSCLQEMPESENIQLCLQDFFIDRRTMHSEQLQRLLKQNKTNIKSLYIYTSSSSSSLREIIDLFSVTDLSHIQKLYYCGDSKKEAEINQILFPSLQAATLFFGEWTNDEENMSENLARCQNLQYLDIGHFKLSKKILEPFFNFISHQKSMKELKLKWLNCKEDGSHDCKRCELDLSLHSTLSKLYLSWLPGILQLNISTPSLVNVKLWRINVDHCSLLLSRDMLNIECVELREIEMSAGSLSNFITVLENLPQSVTVEMYAIKPETEYARVRENIRRSQTFHVIEDGDGFGKFVFKTKKSRMMDTKWI